MLLFTLNNTMILCTIINYCTKISDLIIMQVKQNGIDIQSIDKNKNIMITNYINIKYISTIVSDEIIDLHIKTLNLQNICSKHDEKMLMEFYYFANNQTIEIKMVNEISSKWIYFQIKNSGEPFLLMNHLQYYYNFQFNKQEMANLISSFLTLDKYVKLKIHNKCLHFISCCTLFTGEMIFKNHALMPFAGNSHFNAIFESKYLLSLKHILHLTNNIILSFNSNNPVKIQLTHTFGRTEIFILSINLYN